MTNLQMIQKLQKIVKKNPSNYQAVEDLFEMLRIYESEDFEKAHLWNKDMRRITAQQVRASGSNITLGEKFYNLNKKSLLFDAQSDFDAYLQYVEFDREPEKRFYLPRRKEILPIVQALQDLEDDKLDLLSISMPPGTGKQLSDDTPVLTRKGWVTHGELKIGDEVIGIDGEFKRVTFVFPKAIQNCRVHFSNGDYIDCHENHEWVVYDRGFPLKPERVMETKAIEKRKLESGGEKHVRGHRYIIQIPHREPIKGEFKKLHVPPYTMGAWLGDGTNTKPCITGSKEDLQIVEGVISDGYLIMSSHTHKTTGCHSTNFKNLRGDLKKYGLCNRSKTVEKYIPEEYLTASLNQRLDLLAGLIDTDGTLVGKGKYRFTTSEPRLRDSFIDLISTFGWRVCVREHEPSVSSSGIVGRKPYWTIQFTPSIEIPCRIPRKQYTPNRKPNRIAITKIERLKPKWGNCIEVEGGVYLAGKTMIPTHNSTLGIFFLTWIMGKYPMQPNIASAHSSMLTRSFYDGVLSIITDPEYLWADVFPNIKIAQTNSKEETIDLDKRKRFKTLTCRSIDGSLTGATRCERYLYADDLVSGIEEALSKDRLDNLWNKYTNDLKSRKKLGCKEIHIATRWSVHDVIGRLEQQYKDNPRAKFLAFPAINDEGESNFDYKYNVGFNTKYFLDMRDTLDDVSWKCLFMNEPIEREGLLFPEDDLLYYNGVLPGTEPVCKYFVCDVAWGGGDSLSAPFAYEYEDGSVYIPDVIFNKGDKEVTRPIVVGKLKHHLPHQNRFEANNGGDEYCDAVDAKLKEDGIKLNLTHRKAPSNQSKLSRIIQAAPDIKKFYFLDKKHRSKEYSAFMKELTSFMQTGKNKHDDAPDSLAMLSTLIRNPAGVVEVFRRPF